MSGVRAMNDDPVPPELIPLAVTAGRLTLGDGATQDFDAGGRTTYVEHDRTTLGSGTPRPPRIRTGPR